MFECKKIMNYSSNSTLNFSNVPLLDRHLDKLGVAITYLWIFSSLLDFAILAVIFQSRSTLSRIEFMILFTMRIYWSLLKLSVILTYVDLYLRENIFNSMTKLLINLFVSNVSFIFSTTLIYYSIYHITFLKRSKIFLALFNLVQKPKTFIVYSIVTIIVSPLVTLVSLAILYPEVYGGYIEASFFENTKRIFIMEVILLIIPSICPSLVYFTATVITCYCRLLSTVSSKSSKHTVDAESKRFRKNLRLLLKFLVLAFVYMMCMLPKTIYAIILVYSNFRSPYLEILNYSGDLFFILSSFVIILVHKIIGETFFRNRKQIVHSCCRFFNLIRIF